MAVAEVGVERQWSGVGVVAGVEAGAVQPEDEFVVDAGVAYAEAEVEVEPEVVKAEPEIHQDTHTLPKHQV